jgi:hypothetical protein
MAQHFAMRYWALLFLMPLLTGGCTNMLWQQTDWDCHPAPNTPLQVYEAPRQKDLLIVYKEFSERTKTVQTRAYFLQKNQQQVVSREKPHFVSTNLTRRLTPVPVFQEPQTNFPPPLYVVVSPEKAAFTIYSKQATNLYDLPWYPDSAGRLDRALFGPAAVTVDVVGGTVIVAVGIYCYLRFGCN